MISSLQKVEPASKFKNDDKGLIDGLYLSQLRKILVGVIEDDQSTGFLRDQCIRLMLYVGLVYASGQDLIYAAFAQKEHKTDLRVDLDFLCKQSEKLREPALGGSGGSEYTVENETHIQGTVEFPNTNRTSTGDQMVTDGDYYYNWGEERGLSRSKRTDANYAESGSLYNTEAKQYKGVTMQVYGG
jgi:hypothetical protein